jgi:SAM-dependent methyltransferase
MKSLNKVEPILSQEPLKTASPDDPKEIVRTGYNKISHAYRAEQPDESYQQYEDWVNELRPLLPQHSSVLDLGCGCGLPTTKLLAKEFEVTGVDISEVQIQRAKILVPGATFLCHDMCNLDFPKESFSAIVSFYAIIHVPLEEQPGLFSKLFTWLKPGGYLLATVGFYEWTGTEQDWLAVEGGTMYWSHADKNTYLIWLTQAGFTVLWDRFVPEGNSGHTLVLAQKPEHD